MGMKVFAGPSLEDMVTVALLSEIELTDTEGAQRKST
jgi:hypothetical protein